MSTQQAHHHHHHHAGFAAAGRRAALKEATRGVHEKLDRRIMAFNPFADRQRYQAFLLTQYRLHRDVEAFYVAPQLNAALPQLAERSRLALVELDLHDLGVALPLPGLPEPRFAAGKDVDVATALGWLYAVEGSNIGAAFLLKAAAALELGGGFGARHLAPHPDGRAAHWRDFIAQFDDVALPAADEARCVEGANAAFAQALGYVEQYCALPADGVRA
ncbi:biliverdin-producing heme oxygenase [Corticibacter populi]|uniref:Biliverdin-producing heme oxygenase n=1 Tax=Corticibacter populi TaxID=1550736 RepID=A0A3M6QL55_9BURK|nr:biliverdin-producing heme oxygenase [Corticibacter populi]RMX03461.1 biliverdin-producing heme oxygenase [Corticibacter populi]RZS29899.1 heme oxygenase [Corticibacter populi]